MNCDVLSVVFFNGTQTRRPVGDCCVKPFITTSLAIVQACGQGDAQELKESGDSSQAEVWSVC